MGDFFGDSSRKDKHFFTKQHFLTKNSAENTLYNMVSHRIPANGDTKKERCGPSHAGNRTSTVIIQ